MGAKKQFSGKVTAAWLTKGVWLSEAAKPFGARRFALMCEEAARRFAQLRDGETPESFMISSSLSGPARDRELRNRLIIGEQRQAWVQYCAARDALQTDLWIKLTCGHLMAFGSRGSAAGAPEWIPTQAWFHMKFDPETQDTVRGEGMSYWSVQVVDLADAERSVVKKTPSLEVVMGWVREMHDRPGPPPKVETEVIPECTRRGANYRTAKQAAQAVRRELGLKLGARRKNRAG